MTAASGLAYRELTVGCRFYYSNDRYHKDHDEDHDHVYDESDDDGYLAMEAC